MQNLIADIKKYSAETYMQMTREPSGQLKYPFIVPGSATYNNCLWDWDSWLTDIAVRQIMQDNGSINPDFVECEKGCILNFLEFTSESGAMPICITGERTMPRVYTEKDTNIHKPCLVQHAAFIVRENGGDAEWLRPFAGRLEAFVRYYMETERHEETGLYYWIDDMAIGVDNDPCTFYRPKNSSASIYLNCLMYKELLALCYIFDILGLKSDEFKAESEHLKSAVNEFLWDERNGFYYSADLNLVPLDPNGWLHQGCPRHWSSVIQKIDCWSGALALWAGIATPDKAERVVRENLMNEKIFLANYGIRTLSPLEQQYKIIKSGNPSCWLGPIWGISNYMCYRGMMNYGFQAEATELAHRTIKLFGEDLKNHGQFHEYYHPDTGEGVNNPGFQNWNLLVNNMIAELEGRPVVKEF